LPKDIFLRIADIGVCLYHNPLDEIQLKGAIRKFLVSPVEPDIVVDAGWAELREEAAGALVFDSGGVWKLYDQNGSHLFRLTAPVYGSTPYKEGIFNPDFSRGEIRLHRPAFPPGQPLDPLEYPLDELLIIHYLAAERGVEVHACGIADSLGDGFLFIGQSGAGKSTMASLWKDLSGMTVLSDDRIIIRREAEILRIHGTPWHGDAKCSSPGCARLKSVFFLVKGARNQLIPLNASESSSRLFACSFPLFYSRKAVDFTLSFLGDIARQTPCYELRFVPGAEVVQLVQSLPRI
jgi:hypothetical protein